MAKRSRPILSILLSDGNWGFRYLPQEFQDKLIESDGQQYRVYRLSVNPDLPDMGFVVFVLSCAVLSAEMIANWLVRYADGQLAYQPSAAEMNANIDMMLD